MLKSFVRSSAAKASLLPRSSSGQCGRRSGPLTPPNVHDGGCTAPPPHRRPNRILPCVASRVEHVTDAVVAIPAPVNVAYWDRLNPSVLGPNDDSDDESSNEEVEEFVFLSDGEPQVQMVGPVIVPVEGDRQLPIDVEELPHVADLPIVIVKQEI
ncbi:hypothetical protein D1007_27681 [Hordeum vulgare]|nr:hypothetical protein D1007_27681 [Hordeum vulgare]